MATQQQTLRLAARLGESSPGSDRLAQLGDTLQRAEDELMLYLNLSEWDSRFDSKALELAALYERRDASPDPDAQSISTTEGSLSQSVTYGERDRAEQAVLDSVARYRRVRV